MFMPTIYYKAAVKPDLCKMQRSGFLIYVKILQKPSIIQKFP